jgi:hypothetical protein
MGASWLQLRGRSKTSAPDMRPDRNFVFKRG